MLCSYPLPCISPISPYAMGITYMVFGIFCIGMVWNIKIFISPVYNPADKGLHERLAVSKFNLVAKRCFMTLSEIHLLDHDNVSNNDFRNKSKIIWLSYPELGGNLVALGGICKQRLLKVSSKHLPQSMRIHTHWLHLFDFSPLHCASSNVSLTH